MKIAGIISAVAAIVLSVAPAWCQDRPDNGLGDLPLPIRDQVGREYPNSTILSCDKRDAGAIAYRIVISDELGIERTILVVRRKNDDRQAKLGKSYH
jgi:hypothetical protein